MGIEKFEYIRNEVSFETKKAYLKDHLAGYCFDLVNVTFKSLLKRKFVSDVFRFNTFERYTTYEAFRRKIYDCHKKALAFFRKLDACN